MGMRPAPAASEQQLRDSMTEDPVDLDSRRGMAAQKATIDRRASLDAFRADLEALRARQEELEKHLLARSAETWPEAAAKAEYLVQLFADTLEAQDPRRKKLIADTLADLARMCAQVEDDV